MEDIGSAVDGTLSDVRRVGQIEISECGHRQDRSKLIEKQDLLLIFRPLFSVILILVRFPVQPFTQLAPAAAVHHGLIPVLAEVLCNIILVGVKVDDNDRLAEGGARKGQQQ